jgi:transcriptional regulator with XRE-family HTH domain
MMAIDRILLGKAIRRVRELRGLSQAALAQQAGLRGNSVALIERGQRGVSIETLNELADALKIPAACLTMLGMSKIAGLSESARLVKSMQKLIVATINAQTSMDEKGKSKARTKRAATKKLPKRLARA